MFSLRHKASFQIWWRRQVFRIRRLSFLWFVGGAFICILIVPSLFSSQYHRIPLNQDVQWDSIYELWQIKERILSNDKLSSKVKIIPHDNSAEPHSTAPILIVLYTTIFRDKKFCAFSVEQIFGKSCPSKHRCQWSCEQEKYREADALIFHAYDIPLSKVPLPNRAETKPTSVWILWSDEPPTIIDYALLKSYQFNWTISYKLNSEVSIGSYGLFSKRSTSLSAEKHQSQVEREFSSRTNGALWFVSNCHAHERLELFRGLKDASNLVIEGYGRCVDYYPIHLCGSLSQCESDYMSKFKFYLSFESNTCQDYITEKFYKAFYHGLIPIVYGPKKSDYVRLAPENSFIHVDDFDQDMTQLAKHLHRIHSNLTLFSRYHQWRRNYEVIIDGKALERIRMCELCQRLVNIRRNEVVYYENIEQFYKEGC